MDVAQLALGHVLEIVKTSALQHVAALVQVAVKALVLATAPARPDKHGTSLKRDLCINFKLPHYEKRESKQRNLLKKRVFQKSSKRSNPSFGHHRFGK